MKKLLVAYPGKVAILIIFIILSTGSSIYAGYRLSAYFDIMTSNNLEKALMAAVSLVFLWLLSVFFSYLHAIYKAWLLKIWNNDCRGRMLEKISLLDFEAYEEKEPGEFASWLVNDINQLEKYAILPFFDLLEACFMACFALFSLTLIHPYILMASLVSVLVLTVIPRLFEKTMEQAAAKISQWNEIFSQKVFNVIAGFEVFVTGNSRGQMLKKVKEVYDQSETAKMKFSQKSAFIDMCNTMVFRVFEMSIIILTAILALQGAVSAGMVFAISNISNRFLNGVNKFLSNLILLKSSKPLLAKLEVEQPDRKAFCPPINTHILVDNLSLSFGGHEVLEHLDMEFLCGKKYGIQGESGTGKTTLLKTILGFHNSYEGNIYFDQTERRQLDSDSIFEQIAYISQNVYLFQDTIRFNLTLGRDYSDSQILEALKKVNLDGWIETQEQGLDHMLGDGGKNISGGQRQRLTIARAFLQHKKIFFLDEGTSALDEKNRHLIETVLLSDPELTVVMISHYFTESDLEKLDTLYQLKSR